MPFCEKSGTPIDEGVFSPPPVQPTSQGPPIPVAPPKKNSPYIFIATVIMVVVIIIALVSSSVAVSWSSNHVFTPTAKPGTTTSIPTLKTTISPTTLIPTLKTTVAPVKDPIIGVWRHTHSTTEGIDDYRYRFVADGSWTSSFYDSYHKYLEYNRGTWKNHGGNSYCITYVYPDRESESFNYDPAQSTLFAGWPFTPYQGSLEGV